MADENTGVCSQIPPQPEPEPEAELPDLSAGDIFSKADCGLTPIPVPEWGGKVYVRILSGEQRDLLEKKYKVVDEAKGDKIDATRELLSKMLVMAVCDAAGNPLFKDEDIPRLRSKAATALDRLLKAVQRLSGMTDKDVEAIAKN